MGRARRTYATEAERDKVIAEAIRLASLGTTQQQIADQFGISQATVHGWLKRFGPVKLTMQQQIVEQIRAELVCCDIYQRFMDAGDAAKQRELKAGSDWHDICFYGEWSARIAEGVKLNGRSGNAA